MWQYTAGPPDPACEPGSLELSITRTAVGGLELWTVLDGLFQNRIPIVGPLAEEGCLSRKLKGDASSIFAPLRLNVEGPLAFRFLTTSTAWERLDVVK